MFKSSRIAPALLATSALLLASPSYASDPHIIKLSDSSNTQVLVLRDLDSHLPIGDTGEFLTESGAVAIVGRTEDGLIIDIDGRSLEVPLPASDTSGKRILVSAVASGDSPQRVISIDHRGTSVINSTSEDGDVEHRVLVLSSIDGLESRLEGLDEDLQQRIRESLSRHKGGKSEVRVVVRTEAHGEGE